VKNRPIPQRPPLLSPSGVTKLDRLLEPASVAHPGQSGALLLPDGLDAFAWRVVSIRAAERSIDLQTYIWHSDATGRFLAHEFLQAADRGVRVRLLLDDMDARSRDAILVALNRHPRIEIRLFNPFAARSGTLRTLREMFARGSRLNHRMHNKSWIVDAQLAIVGGRNVGDEYFAASEEVNFIDMDVLLTGRAIEQAVDSFESYWDNVASVPVSRLRRIGRNKYTLDELRRALQESTRLAAESAYARRLAAAPPIETLLQGADRLVWSERVTVVADDPRKANRSKESLAAGVLESMVDALSTAQSEVLLISPYFVPGAGGTAALRNLARRGVRVAVLTNSLAATDVAAVHSGYSRYRQSLLEGGVQLYELKSAAAPSEQDKRMRLGSSRASLHTKAAIVDRQRLFVGSFNLDPRSAELNCEMGAWIESEELAREMLQVFATGTALTNSYTVTLNAHGRACWTEIAEGQRLQYDKDPNAGWARRAITWLLQMLPIESQL
jgi:cardiolipin synthase C